MSSAATVAADVLSPESPISLGRPAREGAATALAFTTITDLAGLDSLAGEWNALFERSAHSSQVFQSFAWVWHWTRHFLVRPGRSLAIVTARHNGRLVLVWPLARTTSRGITQLVWLGEPVSQYGDVLVDQGQDALALMRQTWGHIRESVDADVVNLRKTREDALVAPFLAEVGALSVCHETAPFADLARSGEFETYAGHRWAAKARKNRRRQMRRLEELGAVRIERHAASPEAARLARQAIAVKRAWLCERGLISPALADPAYEEFFAAIAGPDGPAAGCRVSALTVAGEPAALEIAIRCKERLAVHIIAYDARFERQGAGAALMEAGIRDAFQAGITCFDLLGPGGGYKDEWADGAVGIDDYVVPLSLKGQVYARGWLGYVRPRLKSTANSMPLKLRRLATRLTRGVR